MEGVAAEGKEGEREQNLEQPGILQVTGVGTIQLPEGMQIQNFPVNSLQEIVMAMKQAFQERVTTGVSTKKATKSALTVANALAVRLSPSRNGSQLIQSFIQAALKVITHDPSQLLIKLEALADQTWDNMGRDNPCKPYQRKALCTTLIQIYDLMNAVRLDQMDQSGAVLDLQWKPSFGDHRDVERHALVAGLLQDRVRKQSSTYLPTKETSQSLQEDSQEGEEEQKMFLGDSKGDQSLSTMKPSEQVKSHLAKIAKEAKGLTPNSSPSHILYWVLKMHRVLTRLRVGCTIKVQKEILNQAPETLLESLPASLKTPVVLNTSTQNAWNTIQEVYAGINRPARKAAVRGLTVTVLSPGAKDLKSSRR